MTDEPDHAEYVGHFPTLKGERAWIIPDPATYELSLFERKVQVRFFKRGLKHPETGVMLYHGWTIMPAADFKLLVVVRV